MSTSVEKGEEKRVVTLYSTGTITSVSLNSVLVAPAAENQVA